MMWLLWCLSLFVAVDAACPASDVLLSEHNWGVYANCTSFPGNVAIDPAWDSLSMLGADSTNVVRIHGSLTIANSRLADVSFLTEWIVIVGRGIFVQNNSVLGSVWFPILTTSSSVLIDGNPSLTELSGFGSLTYLSGDVRVVNNSLLGSMSAFVNLTHAHSIVIANNSGLRRLEAPTFSVLSAVTRLHVYQNPKLVLLPSFPVLTLVRSSLLLVQLSSLTSLVAFAQLTTVGGSFRISHCTALVNVSLSLSTVSSSSVYRSSNVEGSTVPLRKVVTPNSFDHKSTVKRQSASFVTSSLPSRPSTRVAVSDVTGLPPYLLSDNAPTDALKSVMGGLFVHDNPTLINVVGLESLQRIEHRLLIYNCPKLRRLSDFPSLQLISRDVIIARTGLIACPTFSKLVSILHGRLFIGNNTAMTTVDGFGSLSQVGGDIVVSHNPVMVAISSFNNLFLVHRVRIQCNDKLLSVKVLARVFFNIPYGVCGADGLEVAVVANPRLEVLTLFTSASNVGHVRLVNNSALMALTLGTITAVTGDLLIQGSPTLYAISSDPLSLTPLILVKIHGSFILQDTGLKALDCVMHLRLVGGSLAIVNNDVLTSLDGLAALYSVGVGITTSFVFNKTLLPTGGRNYSVSGGLSAIVNPTLELDTCVDEYINATDLAELMKSSGSGQWWWQWWLQWLQPWWWWGSLGPRTTGYIGVAQRDSFLLPQRLVIFDNSKLATVKGMCGLIQIGGATVGDNQACCRSFVRNLAGSTIFNMSGSFQARHQAICLSVNQTCLADVNDTCGCGKLESLCMNSGVCDSVSPYHCKCSRGELGDFCQGTCAGDTSCNRAGSCVIESASQTYFCDCDRKKNFVGPTCAQCDQGTWGQLCLACPGGTLNPCSGHGYCDIYGTCKCRIDGGHNYSGTSCELCDGCRDTVTPGTLDVSFEYQEASGVAQNAPSWQWWSADLTAVVPAAVAGAMPVSFWPTASFAVASDPSASMPNVSLSGPLRELLNGYGWVWLTGLSPSGVQSGYPAVFDKWGLLTLCLPSNCSETLFSVPMPANLTPGRVVTQNFTFAARSFELRVSSLFQLGTVAIQIRERADADSGDMGRGASASPPLYFRVSIGGIYASSIAAEEYMEESVQEVTVSQFSTRLRGEAASSLGAILGPREVDVVFAWSNALENASQPRISGVGLSRAYSLTTAQLVLIYISWGSTKQNPTLNPTVSHFALLDQCTEDEQTEEEREEFALLEEPADREDRERESSLQAISASRRRRSTLAAAPVQAHQLKQPHMRLLESNRVYLQAFWRLPPDYRRQDDVNNQIIVEDSDDYGGHGDATIWGAWWQDGFDCRAGGRSALGGGEGEGEGESSLSTGDCSGVLLASVAPMTVNVSTYANTTIEWVVRRDILWQGNSFFSRVLMLLNDPPSAPVESPDVLPFREAAVTGQSTDHDLEPVDDMLQLINANAFDAFAPNTELTEYLLSNRSSNSTFGGGFAWRRRSARSAFHDWGHFAIANPDYTGVVYIPLSNNSEFLPPFGSPPAYGEFRFNAHTFSWQASYVSHMTFVLRVVQLTRPLIAFALTFGGDYTSVGSSIFNEQVCDRSDDSHMYYLHWNSDSGMDAFSTAHAAPQVCWVLIPFPAGMSNTLTGTPMSPTETFGCPDYSCPRDPSNAREFVRSSSLTYGFGLMISTGFDSIQATCSALMSNVVLPSQDVPMILSVTPYRVGRGDILTVFGGYFGPSESGLAILIGGRPCEVIPGSLRFNATGHRAFVQCVVPQPTEFDVERLVTIVAGNLRSVEEVTLVYDCPMGYHLAVSGELPGSCVGCGVGFYSNDSTGHVCEQCPAGWYQSRAAGGAQCNYCSTYALNPIYNGAEWCTLEVTFQLVPGAAINLTVLASQLAVGLGIVANQIDVRVQKADAVVVIFRSHGPPEMAIENVVQALINACNNDQLGVDGSFVSVIIPGYGEFRVHPSSRSWFSTLEIYEIVLGSLVAMCVGSMVFLCALRYYRGKYRKVSTKDKDVEMTGPSNGRNETSPTIALGPSSSMSTLMFRSPSPTSSPGHRREASINGDPIAPLQSVAVESSAPGRPHSVTVDSASNHSESELKEPDSARSSVHAEELGLRLAGTGTTASPSSPSPTPPFLKERSHSSVSSHYSQSLYARPNSGVLVWYLASSGGAFARITKSRSAQVVQTAPLESVQVSSVLHPSAVSFPVSQSSDLHPAAPALSLQEAPTSPALTDPPFSLSIQPLSSLNLALSPSLAAILSASSSSLTSLPENSVPPGGDRVLPRSASHPQFPRALVNVARFFADGHSLVVTAELNKSWNHSNHRHARFPTPTDGEFHAAAHHPVPHVHFAAPAHTHAKQNNRAVDSSVHPKSVPVVPVVGHEPPSESNERKGKPSLFDRARASFARAFQFELEYDPERPRHTPPVSQSRSGTGSDSGNSNENSEGGKSNNSSWSKFPSVPLQAVQTSIARPLGPESPRRVAQQQLLNSVSPFAVECDQHGRRLITLSSPP